MKAKHIHFIGICGVAMSALAIAFHKKGYKVTGSDKGFYPPVSTHLKETGIEYYPGWHVEKMTAGGNPDLVIVGNVAGSKNPEWVYVQEHNLEYKSYPEAVAEFFVKENSVVCAGTYGKTTTTTLLSWIFKEAGEDPSYMFGGLAQNKFDSAALGDGTYSILEGDEYKSARWDMRPKFAHYSPTHLLLTAVEWDHADIYKTEQDYFDAFTRLIESVPEHGLIVAHASLAHLTKSAKCRVVTYSQNDEEADYMWTNLTTGPEGSIFDVLHGEEHTRIDANLFGSFNIDNITGCFAIARELGIEIPKVVQAIESFAGIKRRLEKRFDGDVKVYDDIAHSPAKSTSTLEILKSISNGNIIAVFEPNTGNRQVESKEGYDNAFAAADTVIIPRLTKIKIDPNQKHIPFDGPALRAVIAKTHKNVLNIENDDELVAYLSENTKKEDIIVFLGSHGFRGMIESVIDELK